MRMFYIAAAATLCLANQSAARSLTPNNRVAFLTAGALLEICQSKSSICDGYIAAILDTTNNTVDGINLPGPIKGKARVCTVITDKVVTAVAGFILYAGWHPEVAEYSAANVVAASLAEQFPCDG